jgi:integrase
MPSYKLRKSDSGPKNYYAFWSEGRRSKSVSTRTKDKAEAIEFAETYFKELYAEKDAPPAEVLLASVLHRYQDEKGVGTASEKANAQALDSLLGFYSTKAVVSDLNPSNHIAYEKHCRTKSKHMASTINRRRQVLVAALNHAKKNGALSVVPYVPMPPTPLRKERWLSRDEAAWMIRAGRRAKLWYLVPFIRLGLYTAARATAILQLTWDRVDLEMGRIDFRVEGEVETKKKRPNAPINFMLLRALRAARMKTNSQYVIVYRGGPIGLIRKSFIDIAQKAKVKNASPHTLKHTAITWMLRRGLTPWQVSGITNTSVATILRVYGHHVQDDLREAVNAAVGKSAEIVPKSKNSNSALKATKLKQTSI